MAVFAGLNGMVIHTVRQATKTCSIPRRRRSTPLVLWPVRGVFYCDCHGGNSSLETFSRPGLATALHVLEVGRFESEVISGPWGRARYHVRLSLAVEFQGVDGLWSVTM